METNDLDVALSYFHNNRQHYLYFKTIHTDLGVPNKRTYIETQIIIQKLVKDGYIIEESQEDSVFDQRISVRPKREGTHGYLISYEGILFFELGGYREYIKKKKNEEDDAITARTLDLQLKANQIWVNRWSFYLTCASVLFIALTAWFQFSDKTDERLMLIKDAIHSDSSNFKRLESALKPTPVTKTDTSYIKKH